MSDDYMLEVELASLPRGWAVASIAEGMPIAAPPPVLDLIRDIISAAQRAASINGFHEPADRCDKCDLHFTLKRLAPTGDSSDEN